MTAVARLVEVDARTRNPLGTPLDLDFNPQSLRLTHTRTGPAATQGGGTRQDGRTVSAGQQTGYVNDLSMELLFDTSRDGSDVRGKTLVLVALTQPAGAAAAAGRTVRFSWGAFLFVGCITSLAETIDLFSPDGVPLRAAVTLSIQGVAERDVRPGGAGGSAGIGAGLSAGVSAGFGASVGVGASAGVGAGIGAAFGASAGVGASFGVSAGAGASFGAAASASASASVGAAASVGRGVGTTPLTLSVAGDTVQSIAARAGVSWKALAAANGIDNPRRLPPGTVLDVRVATA